MHTEVHKALAARNSSRTLILNSRCKLERVGWIRIVGMGMLEGLLSNTQRGGFLYLSNSERHLSAMTNKTRYFQQMHHGA